MSGPRFCAWCRRAHSAEHGYRGEPVEIYPPGSTHGICPRCLDRHFPDPDQLPPCPLPGRLDSPDSRR